MRSLLEDIRISRCLNAVAAGNDDQAGTAVDMDADGGYDGVLFVAAVGTLTASHVTSLIAQQSNDSGGSPDDFTALDGATTGNLANGDSNKLAVLDVFRPTKRYVRPVVKRATQNAVIDGVIAIQYRGRSRPAINPASVALAVAVVTPAEAS